MSKRRYVLPVVFLVLLAATAAGLFLTSKPVAESGNRSSRRNDPLYRAITAAQDRFETARKLSLLATAREEKWMAREALRIADADVDLAFTNALREAATHPPALTPEAKAIAKRLAGLQAKVDAGQAEIEKLKKDLAAATATTRDALQRHLQLAEAQWELDKDEVEGTRRELSRAGGDPQGYIARLKQRYDAQQQAAGGSQTTVAATPQEPAPPQADTGNNVVALSSTWYALRDKREQLEQARDAVQSQLDQLKQAQEQKSTAVVEKRIENETQLSDTYKRWINFVRERERQAVHGLLYCLLVILIIGFVTTLVDAWLSRSLSSLTADQRQAHTLHTVAGYVLRGIGLVLALLVVFGPPSQFAAVVALVGAGLTVVLKDFVVAFIGWFILMGRHGIRVGDWVEINGVSGEVVEIGPLRTILLETGNLSEAGQPTGRKIAFMNGFAVEGNYLNFSTSGQWMWDEIEFTVPRDADPIATAEAVKQLVVAHNKDNAQLAADEWRRVAPRAGFTALRGEPIVSVRPTGSSVSLAVRYITRAHDRMEERSRLYRALLELQRGEQQAGPAIGQGTGPR